MDNWGLDERENTLSRGIRLDTILCKTQVCLNALGMNSTDAAD